MTAVKSFSYNIMKNYIAIFQSINFLSNCVVLLLLAFLNKKPSDYPTAFLLFSQIILLFFDSSVA